MGRLKRLFTILLVFMMMFGVLQHPHLAYADETQEEPEPAAEEPAAEEPVAEEPVAEEPAAEEPPPEMPVAEEPVHAEEPVLSEPPKAEADPIPEIAGPDNVISPAAVVDPGPGVYDVADSNLILDVSGSSTNDHTQALMAWYDEDGNFYIAVQSTHKLEGTMTIDGITSTDVHVYDAPITTYPIDVEGVTYNTRDLLVNGNTQDTSWTVYMFADAKFSAGTYTFSITGIGGGHDVNNQLLTISVPTIDIHLEKDWVGGEGSRPDVKLQLFIGDDPVIETLITLVHPDTDHTWEDMDATNEYGVELNYTVVETPVPDYDTEVSGNAQEGFTVTNTYAPKTSVTVQKIWEGGPEAKPTIELELYQGETKVGETAELLSGTTSFTWNNLYKTDADGVDYVYTVKEVGEPENYTKVEDGLTVTNTYVSPKIDVTGTKIWDGGPEAKPTIKLELYQGETKVGETAELLSGTTSFTWNNLDKTDADGVDYVYTVKEVGVPENYTKAEAGLTVTNTYVSPKIDVTGTKIWVGGEEFDPEAVFTLLANG